MIIVKIDNSKDGIEKALKKYKKKFDKLKIMKQLRAKKEFEKPSVERRNEIKKAIYAQTKYTNND